MVEIGGYNGLYFKYNRAVSQETLDVHPNGYVDVLGGYVVSQQTRDIEPMMF